MKRICDLDVGPEPDTEKPEELLRLAHDSMVYRTERRKLENWILLNFCCAYNRDQTQKFEWVEDVEPPEPDYRIYTAQDAPAVACEVTEVLDPGRRRQQEYKSALKDARRTGEYLVARDVPEAPADYDAQLIEQTRAVLSKKFDKTKYPVGSWLVVYFNPTLFMPWHEDTLAYATRILTAALQATAAPQRIAQVWVLTNNGQVARLR